MKRQVLRPVYLSAIYGFLYLPIVVLCIFSFNHAQYTQVWHGFTLQWYKKLLHNPDILLATLHSLSIAFLASILSTSIGLMIATALTHYRCAGKKLIHIALFLLVLTPDIILAVSLLLLWNVTHFPLGFWSLWIAHFMLCTPFATLLILSRMNTLDDHLFEAAKDLGASESKIFFYIITPLLWPAILGSCLLSFTLSMDDTIISFFVSGPHFNVLPLYVYSALRTGATPEINALGTMMITLTLLLVLIAHQIMKKK